MPNVIHLVPYDGIGGVETAARSMTDCSDEQIAFQVDYIYPAVVDQKGRYATFNPLPALQAARRIVAGKPDLVVVSLWRSCIVALLAKLLYRRLRLVLFLHLPNDVHWLDRLATRCVAAMATEIWADSQETLKQRLPSVSSENSRVISFITRRTSPLPAKPVSPVFIFWGRIHPQKGLDRAIQIFSTVHEKNTAARFIVIGPDGGDRERIKSLVAAAGLAGAVSFEGSLNFRAIAEHAGSASFYLQTSTVEGMAMSVVEAMQLGLVPVVTPVGEIANYCKHDKNALLVGSNESTVDDIMEVLHDDARYQSLWKNAVASWAGQPLYAQSILDACASILMHDSEEAM